MTGVVEVIKTKKPNPVRGLGFWNDELVIMNE